MVYFIQQGENGPIKIGTANDPKKRLKELQTGNPSRLYLLGMVRGSTEREHHLHKRLTEHQTREKGEWFDPTDEVFAVIEEARENDEVEFERLGGDRIYPVLYRDTADADTDPCPYCGTKHIHGTGDGHRVAHCPTPPRENRHQFEKETGQEEWYIVAADGRIVTRDRGYIVRSRTRAASAV